MVATPEHKIQISFLRRPPDLTNNIDVSNVERPADSSETEANASKTDSPGKRKFVEPELSAPASVLEATTFFQSTTSGQTN